MTACASVCWGRLEQQKVRCIREEGHDAAHTDGCLEWETKPPCPTCIDGTGILLDVENEPSNCPTCRPSYEELKAKVEKLGHEVEARKEWEEAAKMLRASWEAEKKVSADAHKLGYAAAVVDVVGILSVWRPCGPTPQDPLQGLCSACSEGQFGCPNEVLDDAVAKIQAAAPGSLGLVEEAMADRKDVIHSLRSIAAILDGDGGHRQDEDASFQATVERIHLLVCDMRAALSYAERAPGIIENAANIIDEETDHIDEEESDEIRNYASQLSKMLEKVALSPTEGS